jgi:hypothetical protein
MRISTIIKPREGLYLFNVLIEEVGRKHGLSAEGIDHLHSRAIEAIRARALKSRDPESSLPVSEREEVTPLVTLEDFNEWLQAADAANLGIANTPGAAPTDTPAKIEDDTLKFFREQGGKDPSVTGRAWQGTTAVALKLGITRQALTRRLDRAFSREKVANWGWPGHGAPSKGSR